MAPRRHGAEKTLSATKTATSEITREDVPWIMDYKEKLWIQRLRKGYTRKKLGQMIGKHGDSIKQWETGRFAPGNFLDYIRWCRALDMDPMKTIKDDESL